MTVRCVDFPTFVRRTACLLSGLTEQIASFAGGIASVSHDRDCTRGGRNFTSSATSLAPNCRMGLEHLDLFERAQPHPSGTVSNIGVFHAFFVATLASGTSPVDSRLPRHSRERQSPLDAVPCFIPYPAIERLGVVGDRRTAALVAADGTLCWMCVPSYDATPVFGALLDAHKGGFWRIGPSGRRYGEQSYLDRSAILLTT